MAHGDDQCAVLRRLDAGRRSTRSSLPPRARSLTRWRSSSALIPSSAHSAPGRQRAPWTGSYAEERYNGLNSFIFTDSSGNDHAVRWSLTPAAQPGRGRARRARQARAELPRDRDRRAHQERPAALDDAGHGRQRRRSDRGPEQGVAARPSQRRGWHAHRRSRSKPKRTAHAATSISIRPSCRTG